MLIVEIALIAGFLITFGLLLAAVGTAVVGGQRANRAEMERMRDEFERIVDRLGEEEEGGLP